MCAIGGFSLSPSSTVNVHKLAAALLSAGEIRGRDASGFAWVNPNGDGIYKKDVPGSKLHVGRIPNDASAVLIHTRNWTLGSPKIMENNHPLPSPSGNIRLVHNGVIYNHEEVRFVLGETGKKLAEVDSAVIPAVIEELGLENTDLIAGDAAVAWFDRETDDTIHLAKFSHNPITFAELVDGSFVFASTPGILSQALIKCGLSWVGFYPQPFDELAEGEYLQISKGEVMSESTVDWDNAPRSRYASWRAVTDGKITAKELLEKQATEAANAKRLAEERAASATTTGVKAPGSYNTDTHFVSDATGQVERKGSEDRNPMVFSQRDAVQAFFSGQGEDLSQEQIDQWLETGEYDLPEFLSTPEDAESDDDGVEGPTYFSFTHDGDYATYPSLFVMIQTLKWHASLTGGENYLAGPDDGDLRWINHFGDIGVLSEEEDDELSWVQSRDNMSPYEALLPGFIKDGISKLSVMVGA